MCEVGRLRIVCSIFFKQKTAYELRISDWSSDVCSSDLAIPTLEPRNRHGIEPVDPGLLRRNRDIDITALPEALVHRIAEIAEGRDIGPFRQDRKSVVQGKSVSVRVALDGRLILKKKNIYEEL